MRKFIFLASLGFIVFTSCQKEISGTINDPDPVSPNKLLLREIITNDSMPGISDVWSFIYDQQERCIRIDHITYDSTGGVPTKDSGSLVFYYNGDDKLPYKLTPGPPSPSNYLTSFFKYDGLGRKIQDSFATTGAYQVANYTYSANLIIGKMLTNDGTYITVQTDSLYYDGKNITRAVETSQTDTFPARRTQLQDTHDDKFSPYKNLNISPSQFGLCTMCSYQSINQNNILSRQLISSSGTNFNDNFEWIYDTDGYPVSYRDRNYFSYLSVLRVRYEYSK